MWDLRQYGCSLWRIVLLPGVTRWDAVRFSDDRLSKLRFDRQQRYRWDIAPWLAIRNG
jgi:hypothetical protein